MKRKKAVVFVASAIAAAGVYLFVLLRSDVFAGNDTDKVTRELELNALNKTVTIVEYDDGSYGIRGENERYKYMLEQTGTMPNAEKSSRWVVLANKEYTFDEVALSMYSDNSADFIQDIEIIFME